MRFLSLPLFVLASTAAQADAPRVSVDITPVHSLVAQVMEGAGAPDLIMQPGASPHHYALRPSEAAALSQADLVIWMGEGLTPWLGGAISKLAEDVRSIELLEAEGVHLLPLREGVEFDHAAHEEDDHNEDHVDDDDHAGHEHHGDIDPHAWLNPENAQHWLQQIAEELSALDPDHAQLYRSNANDAALRIETLEREVTTLLIPARSTPYLVFHDAYQYFEEAFDISAAAAISLGDAARPGPARIAALRDLVADRNITCALSEPQFDPKLATAIMPDGHRTGILDPMGAKFAPGPGLYDAMMRGLAEAIASCAR